MYKLNFRYSYAAMATVLLAVACGKNQLPLQRQVALQQDTEKTSVENEGFQLTFSANYPVPVDNETRIGLVEDGIDTRLEWKGGEKASVLILSASAATEPSQCVANSFSSSIKGVFSGTVKPGNYTASDVRGLVIPHEAGGYLRYVAGSENKYRIVCPVPTDQVQEKSGEINPVNFPMFAAISSDDLKADEEGSGKHIDDISLWAATNMIRFVVFGNHPEMEPSEVLRSVRVDASDRFSGNVQYIIKDGQTTFNSTGPSYGSISLKEEITIADKDKTNGPVVYLSACLGGSRTVNKITVTTDKAIYTQDFSFSLPQKTVSQFRVYRYALNLGNGKWNRTEAAVEWSTDGGSTWSYEFPASGFTKLAARTSADRPLATADLERIHDAISAESSPVDLDLSASTFTSGVWPDIFKSTGSEPDTKLHSISFPSNITEISREAFAFCSALESVNLSGIATINTKAFYYSGLVDLNVPSSVTSMPGWLTFGCLPNLETVFFDSKAGQIGGNGSSGNNHAHFAFADMTLDYATNNPSEVSDERNVRTNPLVFTVGPNGARFPRYMFKYNKKLTKIIFQKSPSLSNYAFSETPSLQVFDFSAVSSITTNAYPGSNVGLSPGTSADRHIIMNASLVSSRAESDPWKTYVLQNGFSIVDYPSDATAATGDSVKVRIGTFNIRIGTGDSSDANKKWAARRPNLVQSIKDIDFDIFGIQEATNPSTAAYKQHDHLRSDLGSTYGFVFFRPNSGSNNESIGIAYKKADWDILNIRTFWVGPDPKKRTASDKPSTGTYAGSSFYRGAITSVLKHKTTGLKLFFMCTHGMLSTEHNYTYSSVYTSQEALFNPDGLPSFFVGDFNANPSHESSVYYRTYWNDAFLTAATTEGTENTFNGYSAPEGKSRIDFVYWRGDKVSADYYKCDNTQYGGYYTSDHFPVFADFTIKK